MKPIYILLACFLLPGVVEAQTSSPNPDSSANDTNLATEVKALREALLQTQRQMAAQQREIERLKAQSKDGATRTVTNEPTPSPSEIAAADSATSSVEPSTEHAGVNINHQAPTQQLQEQGEPEQVPLGSFRVGDAILELGGFVDLENVFRTTNTQSNIATNFGGFPYNTYDNEFAHRHFHVEVTGLLTGAHASAMPLGSSSFKTHTTVGGGGQIAANYELLHDKLVLLANVFWSDGGAHYLVATGPELVVRPNPAGTDVNLSMVHAGAGSAGLEWRASPKQAFAIYYGADYFGRNFFPDTTNTAHPGTTIGYGGPGSPNTNNRAIQQVTFDWVQTLWKYRRYGALQTYAQYSYLTRAPWFVDPGTPKNAHLSMVYAGFRYVFPSTSGTLERVPYPN